MNFPTDPVCQEVKLEDGVILTLLSSLKMQEKTQTQMMADIMERTYEKFSIKQHGTLYVFHIFIAIAQDQNRFVTVVLKKRQVGKEVDVNHYMGSVPLVIQLNPWGQRLVKGQKSRIVMDFG